jgi:hypothetical protein
MDVVLLRDTGDPLPIVSSTFRLYIKINFGLSTASASRIVHLGSWKRLQIEDLLMLFIAVS